MGECAYCERRPDFTLELIPPTGGTASIEVCENHREELEHGDPDYCSLCGDPADFEIPDDDHNLEGVNLLEFCGDDDCIDPVVHALMEAKPS